VNEIIKKDVKHTFERDGLIQIKTGGERARRGAAVALLRS